MKTPINKEKLRKKTAFFLLRRPIFTLKTAF